MNTTIIEHTEHGDFPIDLFAKLADDRVLFLNENIDNDVASEICATLFLKDMEGDDKISIFINAEKGDIRSVLMIYDTIQMLSAPVETICCGMVMNEVVLLLAAGTKGHRFAMRNSIIAPSQLIHNETYMSDLTEVKSMMDRSIKDNKAFMDALANATGNKLSTVMKDFERRKFFTALQAKKYGVIDGILQKSNSK